MMESKRARATPAVSVDSGLVITKSLSPLHALPSHMMTISTVVQGTWDMLQFGLRLGKRPRWLVTTTPRPIKLHGGAEHAAATISAGPAAEQPIAQDDGRSQCLRSDGVRR